MKTNFSLAAAFAASLAISPAVLADAKTYTGSGQYQTNELTMNLGNGQTVFSARTEGVATLSMEPPALLGLKCMGLGLITGENEFGAKVYCTFRQNKDDSFDLLADSGPSGGTAKIIGGSGRWKGATGSASFKRLSTSDNGGSFSYKIEITEP